jgi:hypothetical protein
MAKQEAASPQRPIRIKRHAGCKLAESKMDEFPNSVCFASKLIFKRVNFLMARQHNHTPVEIQTRLRLQGKQIVLLPTNVG